MLHASLGIRLPRLAKSLTRSLESGLIDLAVAFDDVNLTSSAAGERGDLPRALIPAHRSGAMVESFNEDDLMATPLLRSALLLSALHSCSIMANPHFVK